MQSAVSEKYVFDNDTLVEGFPIYMRSSITLWLRTLFKKNNFLVHDFQENSRITPNTIAMLERNLRTEVARNFLALAQNMYDDEEFGKATLDLLLDKYGAQPVDALKTKLFGEVLEEFLRTAGSAYMAAENENGRWGLFRRVDDITSMQAKPAIAQDMHLKKAWNLCYGANPNPSESIKESTNAIEGMLKSQYFNSETKKITFGQMLGKVRNKGFSFVGSDTMVDSPEELLDLMKKFTKKRGEHVENGCDYGTYDEAVYTLHTAIYVWTLCRGIERG